MLVEEQTLEKFSSRKSIGILRSNYALQILLTKVEYV